ncbi:MAG TPA: hypothetical protein VM141_09585 [Planctomycetota bacterium]|nr:hypothetical protein [Planctomycetota bacterium]
MQRNVQPIVYILIAAGVSCMILLIAVIASGCGGESIQAVEADPEAVVAPEVQYSAQGIAEANQVFKQASDLLKTVRRPDNSIDQTKLRTVSRMLDGAVDEFWRLEKEQPDNQTIKVAIDKINKLRYDVMKSKTVE